MEKDETETWEKKEVLVFHNCLGKSISEVTLLQTSDQAPPDSRGLLSGEVPTYVSTDPCGELRTLHLAHFWFSSGWLFLWFAEDYTVVLLCN